MSHDEYDSGEPVPGLPEKLPAGEAMLWQGAPDAFTMAWKGFHGGLIALYFGALAAFRAASSMHDGMTAGAAFASASHIVVIGAVALAMAGLLGYLVHRTTLYTLTSRRLVMRFGVALPMTLNIPFTQIAAADAKVFGNGAGNIAFTPAGDLPVTYVHLWPHARGWYLARPQPALRCVGDARNVCDMLTKAILANGVTGEVRALKGEASARPSAGVAPSGSMPAAA